VILAVGAIVAELSAFVSIALGYNGPLSMNWLLFNSLVTAGLSLSMLGLVFSVRALRRGDRRNTIMLAAVSNSTTLLLAGGFYAMIFVFEHF
jgi:hypothetical protein